MRLNLFVAYVFIHEDYKGHVHSVS